METIYSVLQEIRPEFDFRTSNDFIEDGFLDSFDVVTLVAELESRFQILVDALDILPENFCSAEAIAAIVKKNGGTL